MAPQDGLRSRKRLCLVSDLDWTMVDHKDVTHDSLLEFNKLWLRECAHDSLLVFSTGRSPQLFEKLANEVPLLTPDILVCSVGTEILINGVSDTQWEAYLNEGWDRDAVSTVGSRFPELILQEITEQRPHKVSYKLYAADEAQAAGVISNLRSQLAGAGLDVNVIFSGGEDVDALPSKASKGKALSFLLKQLEEAAGGPPTSGVMVCGDSGNDIELFAVPGVHGCVVANAHAELKDWCAQNGHSKIFHADHDGPAGIKQALEHFGLVHNPSVVGVPDSNGNITEVVLNTTASGAMVSADDRASRCQAVLGLHDWFESWFNAALPEEGPLDTSALEASFDPGFEIISASGSVMSRAELLDWLNTKGRGSKINNSSLASGLAALSRLAAQTLSPKSTPLASPTAGSKPVSGTSTPFQSGSFSSGGDGARFRIWIDSYTEREIGPGLWLVRYVEVQQRFNEGAGEDGAGGKCGNRTRRVSSAVLRRREEEAPWGWSWVHVHETWLMG